MKLSFVNKLLLIFLFSELVFGKPEVPFKILKKDLEEKNFSWKEVKVGNSNDAKKLMNERVELVLGQLEPTYDPYRGTDSIPEVCLQKNLPKVIGKEIKGGFYKLISLHASKNKIIADCSDEKNLLKAQYLLLYCERGKSIFLIKYFYPFEKEWDSEIIATCEEPE